MNIYSPVDLAASRGNLHDLIQAVTTLGGITIDTVDYAMWSRDIDTLRYAVRTLPSTKLISYRTLFDSLFVNNWGITKYIWRSKLWGVTK
jgi:hypothetical protein